MMKFDRGFALAKVFAGIVWLAFHGASSRAEDDAPRPGQLGRVLSALKGEGEDRVRQGAEWMLNREYVAHLLFIGTDPRGGTSGGGWYRPSKSRYNWDWLSQKCDRNGDGSISLEEFGGRREWFEALDKDRDGVLTKDDFDWSTDSSLTKANSRAKSLFDRIDRDSGGRVTPDEWKLWFDTLSGDKGYVSQDDLIPLFMDRGFRGKGPATPKTGPMSKARLSVVCSYVSGDVGSLSEGPAVDDFAPSFSLLTVDGKNRISFPPKRLPPSDVRIEKPLVLIFGSFT